jgi:hypothetical protein
MILIKIYTGRRSFFHSNLSFFSVLISHTKLLPEGVLNVIFRYLSIKLRNKVKIIFNNCCKTLPCNSDKKNIVFFLFCSVLHFENCENCKILAKKAIDDYVFVVLCSLQSAYIRPIVFLYIMDVLFCFLPLLREPECSFFVSL